MNTKEVFEAIFNGNLWGGRESRSGTGSDMCETENIRRELPILFARLNIACLLDIPCGDLNWMRYVDLSDIDYIGADIVPSAVERAAENSQGMNAKSMTFSELDLINDSLPRVDAVFCRDCLGHLPEADVLKAIQNIKQSGAKYFISTHWPKRGNADCHTGGWRPINLAIYPYDLGEPLEVIIDNGEKTLGAWKI
jgi:hypothetical protein